MNWDGLLLVNKPEGSTSHAVVQRVKQRLQVAKAGHLGTLDPIATGVFPVCLGRATRLAWFYMGADKRYLAAIRFGFFTTTDDREGQPEKPFSKVKFSEQQLKKTVQTFVGEYDQRPPVFSAKKTKGKKAYELARKGQKPDLPLQKVKIYEIKLLRFQGDMAIVEMHCSTGTYVRSFARELGQRLGCGAHIHELRRTGFGSFQLDQCCGPEDSETKMRQAFIPMEKMLAEFPEVVVEADNTKKILTGSSIEWTDSIPEEWVKVFSPDRTFLAVAKVDTKEKRIQPKIVFS